MLFQRLKVCLYNFQGAVYLVLLKLLSSKEKSLSTPSKVSDGKPSLDMVKEIDINHDDTSMEMEHLSDGSRNKMKKELVKFRTSTKLKHDMIAVGGEDSSGPGVAPTESCESYAEVKIHVVSHETTLKISFLSRFCSYMYVQWQTAVHQTFIKFCSLPNKSFCCTYITTSEINLLHIETTWL